mmetsp:Transcript_15622/g.43165  ORF Transcript_15622/g.43165 Transcript_15622/m.43165 type:complete len:151 (-) Transcript_15622:583-1035(-)
MTANNHSKPQLVTRASGPRQLSWMQRQERRRSVDLGLRLAMTTQRRTTTLSGMNPAILALSASRGSSLVDHVCPSYLNSSSTSSEMGRREVRSEHEQVVDLMSILQEAIDIASDDAACTSSESLHSSNQPSIDAPPAVELARQQQRQQQQ